MHGSLDANELALQLLEGLDTLHVGPMLRSELARRLAERGLATPPLPPTEKRGRPLGGGDRRLLLKKAIEVASSGEIKVWYGLVRSTRGASGRFKVSYSGTGQSRWDDVIGRDGLEAFAERVRQLVEGEAGVDFEVGFGMDRTDSRTISLRRTYVEPSDRNSD